MAAENIRSNLTMLTKVLSQTLNTPPGSPAEGDGYIVGSAPTGAWSGHPRELAVWDGSIWIFTTPQEDFTIWVDDEQSFYFYQGGAWGRVTKKSTIYSISSGSTLTGSSVGSDAVISPMTLTAVDAPSAPGEVEPGDYTVFFWVDLEVPSGVTCDLVLYVNGAAMANTRANHDGPGATRWSASIAARIATVALGQTIEARTQTTGGDVTFRDRRLVAILE